MAEYIYTIDDFSLTTTWKRMVQSTGIVSYDIVSSSATKTFSLDGMILADGENIKRVILSASFRRVGTTEYDEVISVNGLGFSSGTRKLDASEFTPGATWDARFYFCTSGNHGTAGALNQPVTHQCTLYVTNVTLTITTGIGSAFDGEISSLPEGSKILIDEPDGTKGTYSIVHHGYSDSTLCLLWRDNALSNTAMFNQNSDTFISDNVSNLDGYLNVSFYNALPETTKAHIQLAIYPTLDKRLYGTVTNIERYVCTPSVRELKETTGSAEWHGVPLDYLDTVNSGEIYWTRSVYTSSAGYAYYINASGSAYSYNRGYARGVRPCFCVLEEQKVMPGDEDGTFYVLASAVDAPSNVYLNGAESDLEGQQRDTSVILSWEPVSSTLVTGYEVWSCDISDGEYAFLGAVSAGDDGTIPTELAVRTGGKGFVNLYFKVKAVTVPDTDYLDSDLSSIYRLLATKRTNVHYYDGTRWLLAMPNYYDGSWKQTDGMKYYDGSQWIE